MEVAFLHDVSARKTKENKLLMDCCGEMAKERNQAIMERDRAMDKISKLERAIYGYKSDDGKKDPDYSPPSKRAKNIRKI